MEIPGLIKRISAGIARRIAHKFWKRISAGDEIKYLFKEVKYVFDGIPVQFDEPLYASYIEMDSKRCSGQEAYVVEMQDVIIEPKRGFGINGLNKVIDQTIFSPGYQFPYIFPYLYKRWGAKFLEQAVAYDAYLSLNYYHHLLNGVNCIHMLEKVDLPTHIPFIISRRIFDHQYFQYLYKRSEKIRKINWIVQEPNEWYRVRKLYKLQCVHMEKDPWIKTLELYNLPPKESFRKIFLSRDSKRFGRGLSNEKEISQMLEKYGFETVYAENLSVEEQTELFQTTKYLVALHGAGLVQQVFMNFESAHIIEIMPKDYIVGFYYWQAHMLGLKYFDVVIGGALAGTKNYQLEEDVLEKAVKKMLDSNCKGKVYGKTLL